MRKKFTLEEIIKESNLVLFDNCGTHGIMNRVGTDNFRKKDLKKNLEFNKYLKEKINGNNIYITNKVREELNKKTRQYYQIKTGGYHGKEDSITLEEYIKFEIGREELSKCFLYNDRILELNKEGEEILFQLGNKYEKIPKMKRLSDTDFEIVIYGIIAIQDKDKIAIVTNDFTIPQVGVKIAKGEDIKKGKIKYFKHLVPFEFKEYFENYMF